MAKKITSLYIDDERIRLLVTRGDQVKVWDEVTLRAGLVEKMVVRNAPKVAERVVRLLKQNKVKTHKVIVCISAEQCLTRQIILPSMPRTLLAEAINREAKRQLPLPPEELYLSWQTIATPEGKIQVFLVGMRRNSIDSICNALKIARIQPATLVIKPMALASLIKEPGAIIVDIQVNDFDIVIVVNGVPQPMRTVSFPSSSLTWEEKTPFLEDEIERTIKFHNSTNPDKPLTSEIPMYVSGELGNLSKLCQQLSNKFGFKVMVLTPRFKSNTRGFKPQMYLANIGASAQEMVKNRNIDLPVASLNLLPVEHRVKPINWFRVLVLPVSMVFFGLGMPLIAVISSGANNIASAREQLEYTNQVLVEKQLQKVSMKKEITDLGEKLASLKASRDACSLMLDRLDKKAGMIINDLHLTMDNPPPGTQLTRIALNKDNLTISGNGPDESIILAYARTLDQSGCFSKTIVDNISLQQDGLESFNLILTR